MGHWLKTQRWWPLCWSSRVAESVSECPVQRRALTLAEPPCAQSLTLFLGHQLLGLVLRIWEAARRITSFVFCDYYLDPAFVVVGLIQSGIKTWACTCNANTLPLSSIPSPEMSISTYIPWSCGRRREFPSDTITLSGPHERHCPGNKAIPRRPCLRRPHYTGKTTKGSKHCRSPSENTQTSWCQSWAWNYGLRSVVTNNSCWTKVNYDSSVSLSKALYPPYSCLHSQGGSIDSNKQIKHIQRKTTTF